MTLYAGGESAHKPQPPSAGVLRPPVGSPRRGPRHAVTLPVVADEAVERARQAGAALVKHTPVTSSATLSERCGGEIVLKAENLQRTGSFKIRGALAKLADLGERARPGVVAGSAGNHAQAVAFAARHAGVPCEIYMPASASIAKTEATRGYGAKVVLGGDALDDAVAAATARAAESGMVFVHPDLAVVAGQATLGLELAEDVPGLRRVIVPLGGGGLASVDEDDVADAMVM